MITDDLERIAAYIVRVEGIQLDCMHTDTLQSILYEPLHYIQRQAGYTNCLLSLSGVRSWVCLACAEHPDS